MKLEQNLNLLHIGESQPFFGLGETLKYDNKGDRTWALRVSGLQFGPLKVGDLDGGAADSDAFFGDLDTST